MNLQGKKILITGGSSGIGKATALQCALQGAEVAILALDLEATDLAASEIRNRGGRIKGYACDVSDPVALKSVLNRIFQDFSEIDVLVNNAGYATYKTFAESTLEEIDQMTKVNYLGTLYCCKLVLDRMITQKRGHVINIASVAGRLPITPNPIYAASKSAIVAMTYLLKIEYASLGIDFSLVLPGRVDTPFFDHPTFKRRRLGFENKKALAPEVIAQAIIKAMISKTYLVVRPRFYKIIFWIGDAFPFLFKPILLVVLKKRIQKHYDDVGWPR